MATVYLLCISVLLMLVHCVAQVGSVSFLFIRCHIGVGGVFLSLKEKHLTRLKHSIVKLKQISKYLVLGQCLSSSQPHEVFFLKNNKVFIQYIYNDTWPSELDYVFLWVPKHLRCCPQTFEQFSTSIQTYTRVCNHVIAVYSENKLQHYATAYRNHKSAGEKLCLVSNLYFSSKPG